MLTQHLSLKSRRALRLPILVLVAASLLSVVTMSGCSKSGRSGEAPPATTATAGVLRLGTAGTSGLIAGVDLRLNLPSGVTVAANPATGETATGVVTASGAAGSNTLVMAKHAPAADGAPARVRILAASAAGFKTGEFVTIRFSVAAGADFPAAGDFSLASFIAKGPDGATLGGVTAAPLSVEAIDDADAARASITVTGAPLPALTLTVTSPTNTTNQTISGTVTPGLTPTVTVTPPAVVSAVTVTGFNWTANVSGMVDGPNTITATVNTGGGTIVIASVDIVVDRVPPVLVVEAVLSTHNSTDMIAGSVELFSDVTVTCGGGADAGIPVVAGTGWSVLISNLSYGANHCKVTATDAAGNQTTVDVNINFDNIAPYLDLHVNGLVKYGTVQTISGTVESGVTPSVTVNTGAVVSSVTTTGASWSCTLSGLTEGANMVTATATDTAGNTTTQTATITSYVSNGSFSGASQPTIADALKALGYAIGLNVPTVADLVYGDIYDDGLYIIDVADVILILNKIVDLPAIQPYGYGYTIP